MTGLLACRCPGKFFAEAEVALIALLLLSEHRVQLSPAGGKCDRGVNATCCSTAECSCLAGPSLMAIQQDWKGNHTYQQEQDGAELSSCVEEASSLTRGYGSSARPASSCKHASQTALCHSASIAEAQHSISTRPGCFFPGYSSIAQQAVCSCKLCCQMLKQEERSNADCSPGLPLPELRRQVGIRWPQHDVLVSLG